MFAEQLKGGVLVRGKRVTRMAPAIGSDGRRWVRCLFTDGSWDMFEVGKRVPGTRPRTDIPAGPVNAGRGAKSTARGRRDGESARDRHSRFIDGLVYA